MGAPDRLVCGPIDREGSFIQYFRSPADYLSGLSIKFATYRKRLSHRLFINVERLVAAGHDDYDLEHVERVPVFSLDMSAEGVSDAEYFNLYFPTLPDSEGAFFSVAISSDGVRRGEAITAWLSRGEERIPGHLSCTGREAFGDGFGLQARLITSNPSVAGAYPPGLLYSPLSSCNMNCTHCISRHSRQRAVHMSDNIKDAIKRHVESGELRWLFTDYSGDIFFAEHKKPGELDFLFGLGIAIHIDTNGAYLDQATIDRVMTSPVDALSISVDAARDETYAKIRIGAPPIDQIFAAARAAVESRRRHGREANFGISLGFTLMLSNLHELPLFIQKAARTGVDSVGCRHLEVYHDNMDAESLFYHRDYFNSIRAACMELARSLNIQLLIEDELREHAALNDNPPCMIPWGSAVILSNGDIMACCVPGSKMGNILKQPLESIWGGEGYRRLRSRVNSDNPPGLCKNCHFRNSLNSHGSGAAFRASRSARPLLEELMLENGD